jgi:hypothetical protein
VDRAENSLGGGSRLNPDMYREMKMAHWLEKAEAEMGVSR